MWGREVVGSEAPMGFGELGEKDTYFKETGEQRQNVEGLRGTNAIFLGEHEKQRQYWGTGNTRKHFLFLGNRGTSQ